MDERLRPIEYIKEVAHHITLADGTQLSDISINGK